MKTLYLDVYFMINFTVDILAVFIASKMLHIKTNIKRLIASGMVGACLAVVELFIKNKALHIFIASIFIFIIYFISCNGVSFFRGVRFIISFYIASFLISGIVTFIYGLMDKYLDEFLSEHSVTTNRKAIVFSLIILLIIGALRLFIMMFSDSINKKSVRIMIEIEGKSVWVEALIDTGNLVKDPMNMNPVIFLKKTYAQEIIPNSVIELSDLDSLSSGFRKRIRLIPVTRNSETHVMTGVRVDRVVICNEKNNEEINATIVIDKEEGTFGGYYALAPYVAVCNNA